MARSARAGERRTLIRVVAPVGGVNENGFPNEGTAEVLTKWCKWVNAHGSEVYDARQAGVIEPATLTMRYTDKITPSCEIYRGKAPEPYEVVSVNDVEDRHIWLEVKVQRKAVSRDA